MQQTRTAESLVGRALGEFVVRDELGAGGFGLVYRAHQPLLDREAVVKVLHARHQANEQLIQRFMREARLASKLDHPFAAHIYAFGAESDGLLWIAMELVRGTPLDELLESRGRVPLEQFAPLLDRICEVVHTAHEHGIVHRDLKPANVMVLSRAGRLLPKLLDFGIAKLANEELGVGSPAVPLSAAGDAAVSGLTQDTFALGSPAYMAPEQWVDPGGADARADIYAIGALAYEALTGRPPFRSKSLLGLAKAHARKPVPPLGEGLPATLDDVIATAMAKQRDDRYASAMELGVAFREAAGLAAQQARLPHLDEALREDLVAEAPQPLAEAVAAYDAARNVHQARDAMRLVLHVTVQYLGVLALASRTRVGPGGGADASEVVEALRALRRRGITDARWVSLARELVRPWASRRDAHPIPELVALFCDRTGAATESAEGLDRLAQLGALDRAGGSERDVLDAFRIFVDELNRVLRSLRFLFDYRLVVPRDSEVADSWMGLRRTPRAATALSDAGLPAGRPVLADRRGAPVLALWPLAQVAAPAPGTPEEMFVLDGGGAHGARLVSLPRGFEHTDAALWDWFREHLDVEGEVEHVREQERAPYRGLAAFTEEDADDYVGREREVEAFLNRLRVHAFLAVVGPSGSGKSSFVRAGVLPALGDRARVTIVRPGLAPLAGLGACLAHRGVDIEGCAADPEVLGRTLRADVEGTDAMHVIVVDQFEELLTLCHDAHEREVFADALSRAARTVDEPVRVILTLRDDFLIRAQQIPALRDRLSHGIQLLGTPGPDDLVRILVEPARRAGYEFDDESLPRDMVDDVAEEPGALALLSFAATKLWELRDRHFKQLTRTAYDSVGGVGGALAQHAEAVLEQMPPDQQSLVREAFRHLVTAEGTRAVMGRSDLVHVLGDDARARAAVEHLIEARLVVASEDEVGEDRIELVHEALLNAWPRLVRWRVEDAEGARLRDQLRDAARQWQQRGRPGGLLWRDEALAEYEIWRSRHASRLTPSERAFAEASLAAAAAGRVKRRIAFATVVVSLAAGLAVLFWMKTRADAEREKADRSAATASARLAGIYKGRGAEELLSDQPLRSMPYLEAAYELGERGAGLQFMVAEAIRRAGSEPTVLEPHVGWAAFARFLPDGRRVVTGDMNNAYLWDAKTGRRLQTFEQKTGAWWVGVSPDSSMVATGGIDGAVNVWATSTGERLHSLEGHTGMIWSLAFSPDGTLLATSSDDGTARVWDVTTGQTRHVLERQPLELRPKGPTQHEVSFSPDGTQLVTTSLIGEARVWNAATGKLSWRLDGHEGAVHLARFSPDGTLLATAGRDTSPRLWDTTSGALLRTLPHTDLVIGLTYRPDGRHIATASNDGNARTWDVATGDLVQTFSAHTRDVWSVEYCADGRQLVTASADTTAKLWSEDGMVLKTFVGHGDRLIRAFFDPACQRVVTSSTDGTARIWTTVGDSVIAQLPGHAGGAASVFFRPDGSRVFTTSADGGGVYVWDAATWERIAEFQVPDIGDGLVEVSEDGRYVLAMTGATGSTWDLDAGSRLATLEGHTDTINWGIFSFDGTRVATGDLHGDTIVWNTRTGERVLAIDGGGKIGAAVQFVGFRPDDAQLIVSSMIATRIHDGDSGDVLVELDTGGAPVTMGRFTADGQHVLTTNPDRPAEIWNAQTGQSELAIEAIGEGTSAAAISADGSLIATGSRSGEVRLWDGHDGTALAAIRAHTLVAGTGMTVRWIEFSADSQALATAGSDGYVRVWDVSHEVTGEEIDVFMACRVPWRLTDQKLSSAAVDPSRCPDNPDFK